MYDSVSTEDEIDWAVKKILNHRSGGPSGIRSKHLKGWLAAAEREVKGGGCGQKLAPNREEDNGRAQQDGGGGDTTEIREDTPTEASN